jgi:hypothetical protein
LYGVNNVENRAVVIHELPDDLGLTDHSLSNTTGNSGLRIACGLIRYSYKGPSGSMKMSGDYMAIFAAIFGLLFF